MVSININNNPRIVIIQKLYSKNLNKDLELDFPKHRYKKFIKDVVQGTLERKEFIDETISLHIGTDIHFEKTEKLLIILLQAAVFEFLYKPQTAVNIIINEYLNTAKAFLDENQKKFLNALLDKISKKIRTNNEWIWNY